MPIPLISFCTVVMNRLKDLKQTLSINLAQNNSSEVQFILLDYNSTDGTDLYVQSNFAREINNRRLIYYKYEDSAFFKRSHSRNLAFKLADGQILCNLDADNFAGPGFWLYIQSLFSSSKNICLTGINNMHEPGATGKLCLSKNAFFSVTGFDESFSGYGFEDYDIVNRLQLSGCNVFTLGKKEFLTALSHDNLERIRNESFFHSVVSVLINYIDENISKVVFLLRDSKCITGNIINTYTLNSSRPSIVMLDETLPLSQFRVEGGWKHGIWARSGRDIFLNQKILRSHVHQGHQILQSGSNTYYPVPDGAMKAQTICYYSETHNREIMLKNLSAKKIRVNQCFGQGIVFKNFNKLPLTNEA